MMHRLIKIITIIFLQATASTLIAQNLSITRDTLVWDVDHFQTTSNDSTIAYSCKFITYRTNKIAWVQKAGQYVMEFDVNSVQGDWSDPLTSGSLTFEVNYLGKSGTVSFSKSGNQIRVQMSFMDNGVNTLPGIFNIQQINQRL